MELHRQRADNDSSREALSMAKNRTTKASTSDAMKTVADALVKAFKAAKGDTADATAAAGRALPAASRFLYRLVYTTSYTFSYGIVFPTMMLARSIPENNSIVQGFVDGGRAASDGSKVGNIVQRNPPPTRRPCVPSRARPGSGKAPASRFPATASPEEARFQERKSASIGAVRPPMGRRWPAPRLGSCP